MHPLLFRPSFFPLVMILALSPIQLVAAADSFNPLSVKLTVTESAGLARIQEPITIGIPIPQTANILDTSKMKITATNGTTSIPAQFTVLTRWGGLATDTAKPIYWVQADFEADVPAGTIATFYLKNDGSYIPTGMTATSASAFTVTTGTATSS